MTKKIFTTLTFFVIILHVVIAQIKNGNLSEDGEQLKPRLVVLTDIAYPDVEPDDHESLIRLLVHADLLEVEAIIFTTGWSIGNVDGALKNLNIIHGAIDAYEKDLPNLEKRNGEQVYSNDANKQVIGYWPNPDYFRRRTVIGSRRQGMKYIGENNSSAGSNLIIDLVDEDDERPLWITVWGGGNTLAQAIWQVQQTRSADELNKFLKKLRVYTITDQDVNWQARNNLKISSHYWMRENFSKNLLFIWDECTWFYQNSIGKSNWEEYAQHIQNHGHLGEQYPKFKWGVEGDTPSFLHLIPNGLNDPNDPSQCSWGGYSVPAICRDSTTTAYTNFEGTPQYEICKAYFNNKFYQAAFNNFAARMDWAENGEGNRNPVVIVNGNSGLSSILMDATAGEKLSLNASGSYDPDDDELSYNWWIQPEAGTYASMIEISNPTAKRIKIKVPEDSMAKSFHIICELTDKGTPALSAYRRIIVNVK